MLLLLLLQVCDLGDPDPDVRERASAALRNAGARAVPALVQALRSNDQEVVSRADELLDELADAGGVTGLHIFLTDTETDGTRVNGRVVAENRGRVPLRIDLADIAVENLQVDSRASGIRRLLPGEFAEIRVSGRLTASNPRPVYGGRVAGQRVVMDAPPEVQVHIVRLKNAQAHATKALLDEAFRVDVLLVETTADRVTNTIILKGRREYLDVAMEVIDVLDRDPYEP